MLRTHVPWQTTQLSKNGTRNIPVDDAYTTDFRFQACSCTGSALEIQLETLAKTGGQDTPDMEKRWQEALVKLGTAEQKALRAQHDLKAQQGAQDALMGEIEAVSDAYDEVQAKNDSLQQVRM